MNKKRILSTLIVVTVILIICFALYRHLLHKPYLDDQNIGRITITLTNSMPVKTIELNAENMRVFTSLYNEYDFKPVIHANDKGWEILVKTMGSQDHSISFLGKYIKFDEIWYATDESLKEKIIELFGNNY